MNGEKEEKDPAAAPPPVADRGGRVWSWLYEIPVFYFLLWAAQRAAFPGSPGFLDFNPNPYWLGPLLFALRYGMGAGLLSGSASAAMLALGARQAGESYRLQDLDFYLQPGLLVIAGAALGGVADRFAHRLALLNRKVEDAAERIRGLQNHLQTQQRSMRAVEQQVVSQMSSVVTLYYGSRRLGTLDRAALLPAALDFFARALPASKAALYVRAADGAWEVLDRRGWEKDDEYPRRVAPGEGVVGRAAQERRVTSVKDLLVAESEPGAPSSAEAIMAAPILDPEGAVAAVFAVQAMPFLRFNSASLNLLTLLVEWGGESLAKCAEVEALKSRSLLDEELSVNSARYLDARAGQEFSRSRRYALPLSLLLVRADVASLAEELRPSFLRALARALRESAAREIDVVARSPWPEAQFAVLLITATRETAEQIREHALQALRTLELPAPVRIGLGSYKASMERPEEIVEQAKADLG